MLRRSESGCLGGVERAQAHCVPERRLRRSPDPDQQLGSPVEEWGRWSFHRGEAEREIPQGERY